MTPGPATGTEHSRIARLVMTAYGVAVYAVFLVVFVYAIGFVEGLVVPKDIDDGIAGTAGTAVLVNLVLLGVFAVQHSVMARPWFKRAWTRWVPQPIERTTYVAFATTALALLLWGWRPIPEVVWHVDVAWVRVVLYAISFGGWGLLLLSTFLIDHFDLFGLRQVVRHQQRRPQTSPEFQTPLVYRVVRHPLYLGFLIAFWVAPTMSVGRLLFAAGTTTYILLAIRWEERDLVHHLGQDYAAYREEVPGLVPFATSAAGRRRDELADA